MRAKIVKATYAPEPSHEPQEAAAAEESHIGSGSRNQRQIAAELKRVAKSLLVEDDEFLARPIFPAPFLDGELQFRFRREPADPATFIALPALFEISAKKTKRAFVVLCVGGIGFIAERRIESGLSFDKEALFLERDAAADERGRIGRRQQQGAIEGRECFFRRRQLQEQHTAIEERLGEVAFGRECQIERGERGLKLTEFLKNDRTIVEQIGMAGKNLEGFRAGAECRFERTKPMEPVGSIEVGFVKIRLNPQRFFDKFERVFELACLAEQDRAGAQGVGIGGFQPQGLIEGGDGFVASSEDAQDDAAVIEGHRVVKSEVQGLVVGFERLLAATELLKDRAHLADRFRIAGTKRPGPRKPAERLGRILGSDEDEPRKVTTLGTGDESRIEREEPLARRLGAS